MSVALRHLVPFARARLRGRPHPFSITFILTDRCNFRCDYCEIPEEPTPEMTTADFCAAIDAFADAGTARASFSGGEALLRKDAVDIIAHAHARGMFTSLNSNGWLTPRHFEALAPHLDMLVLSLDGDAATHDALCHQAGSHARVLETLERAAARGISLATISVLGPSNLDCVDGVLAVAARYGAWAFFQPAQSDCYDHRSGVDLSTAQLAALADTLDRARRDGGRVAASPGYMERLRRAPHYRDCAACHAGRYFASVLPDGRVVPCHLTSDDAPYLDGREVGFVEAFRRIPRERTGQGCLISPYVESDLIFSLDPRAIRDALRKMGRGPASTWRSAG